MKIERILVPTDFSEPSLRALTVAEDWARTSHAALVLLHVVDIQPTAVTREFGMMDKSFQDFIDDDARKHLQRLAAGLEGLSVTCIVRHGQPAPQIAMMAAEKKADLIVMATHGRKGFSRLLLGSTTEEVIRIATCPVLSVHRQGHAVPIPHDVAHAASKV